VILRVPNNRKWRRRGRRRITGVSQNMMMMMMMMMMVVVVVGIYQASATGASVNTRSIEIEGILHL